MENRDRYALITGASSGIGYEFAVLFARDGTNLVITARNKAKLDAVKAEIEREYQVKVRIMARDLADPEAPQEIFHELEEAGIHVKALVNNAGFNVYGLFAESDLEKEIEMIQVHITSLTHLTKLFLSKMLEDESGRILNVSSIAALAPGPLVSVHFASRAYVLHFSEALANELLGTGVTVTCLCPGPTESDFFKRAGMESVRLATGWPVRLMDARKAAEAGYKGLMRGKPVVIPGFRNRSLAFIARVAPRRMVVGFTRWLMSRTAQN
jgi:short-subunit dehydrogenase